jgi:purine-binding chemotaxis protein CheW
VSESNNDTAQILQARARVLARPKQRDDAAEGFLELLEFRLASERYAVEMGHVEEVQPLRDLTPLPGVPAFIPGIVNIRGRILPVLDLKKFFDLPEQGLTDLHRIILVRGPEVELGLLADTIVGIRRLAPARLQPSLHTLTGIRADFLKGVSDERLVVLDLERILSDPKIVVHDEGESVS